MLSAYDAEQNARLLIMLKEQIQAKDLGAIHGFFEVEARWRCPCCWRSKPEIARLDKNEDLFCALHWHHDHFVECINLPGNVAPEAVAAIEASLLRFPNTLICGDCNVAEPNAKKLVGAPAAFSFAPFEISGFINVIKNNKHTVDADRAAATYDAAKKAMGGIAARLRSIREALKSEDLGAFEPVGAAALRVVLTAREKMDREKP